MEISKDLLKAIKQAQEGREEGFNKVYSSTYNFVYFRSKTIMKTDDEAWDLLQEVYIVAYKSISKLEKPDNLYAWLGGIVYNLGMKAYRKKKEVLLDEESDGIFDEIQSTDKDIQPEEYIEDKQTSNIVKELIDLLPPLQKAAVIAYYYDEMSVKEIASIFECSEGTIKSRLNYARQFLKHAVEERENRDGIKLHSVTIPTILIALRMLSQDSAVSAQAAQMAYNAVCVSIGIESTALSTIAGISNTVGTGAQATGAATKATGLIAKFTTASIGTKTAIIGLTAVISISSAIGSVMINNRNEKPVQSMVTNIEIIPTPEISKEEVVIPTVSPEEAITLSDEEMEIFNLIIKGLVDSIESGYKKGVKLTGEQKMGIAYQVMYSLCISGGNKFGYTEGKIKYEDINFEGDALLSQTYLIPKEDIDLLLNTIIGETITEDKDYQGFIFQFGYYYLVKDCTYVGFKDFWKDNKTVSYNYRERRKFELIETETTNKKAFQEGIREIGHAGTDAIETIEKSSYRIEFEAIEPSKFGRYCITSFKEDNIDSTMQSTFNQEEKDYSKFYDAFKNFLENYEQHLTPIRYKDYEYSEYFLYDWNNEEPPILITRDKYNKIPCDYYDIHYIAETDDIKVENMSLITASRETLFYKKDNGFIELLDDLEDSTYFAYFYRTLEGKDTQKDELWFWYRKDDGTTFNFDLDSYKEKRAEVESLELIQWYPIGDLSPFE